MRLYKMELYKLCHRKIFIAGAVCVIGILLLSFVMLTYDYEEATVDGIKYTGFKAVWVNRQITEEFKGVLTDEKVERIVAKYGFPCKVEEGWNHFRDGNFLNQFVMDYLSDGYMWSWTGDYKVAEHVYPIADSDLGTVMEITGKEIVLEYHHGWNVFLDVLSIGMISGSILILFSISAVFANEGQTKMLQLIFTAREGRGKEVYAKIAAAFTVAAVVWLVILSLDLLLCGTVYGFDGLDCYNGMVTSHLLPWRNRMILMRYYIAIAILFSFLGIFSLCAITMCISACNNNSFHAVELAAVCFLTPVLVAMLTDVGELSGVHKLLSAAPVFMVIHTTIEDVHEVWLLPPIVAAAVSIFCIIKAYRKYIGQQCGK